MHTSEPVAARSPTRTALAACLSIALGLAPPLAMSKPLRSGLLEHIDHASNAREADTTQVLPVYLRAQLIRASGDNPSVGTDHLVTKCGDDGSAGTLRAVIGDPNTVSGDSINLTQLPTMMCSTITLSGSAIVINQDELHIHGPGAESLAIDGNETSDVLEHFGNGTLGITGVTIANGHYISDIGPQGGCIYSESNVLLLDSVVTHCVVEATSTTPAKGGGVYAHGYLTLVDSAITGNEAKATAASGAHSKGGGAFALGDLTLANSTIDNNSAYAAPSATSSSTGGGIFARSNSYIQGSTISGNHAKYFGGIDLAYSSAPSVETILNSTVSGNYANMSGGAIYSNSPLTIANTTVAFNSSLNDDTYAAGVYVNGAPVTIESSIIAGNDGPNGPNDLSGSNVPISGGNNLITSSTIGVPLPNVAACPKLDPLASNGGSTLTHKVRHDSPAIDQGNPGTLQFDQRGADRVYPLNGQADIGAVEWQPSDIDERLLASNFDDPCG